MRVLCAIVDRMQRENIIAKGLFREGYFCGYFLFARNCGKGLKDDFMPHHAEALGAITEMAWGRPGLVAGYRQGQSVSRWRSEELMVGGVRYNQW